MKTISVLAFLIFSSFLAFSQPPPDPRCLPITEYITRRGRQCIMRMVIITGMHITDTIIMAITVTTAITTIIITEGQCTIIKLKLKAQSLKLTWMKSLIK